LPSFTFVYSLSSWQNFFDEGKCLIVVCFYLIDQINIVTTAPLSADVSSH